MTLTTLKQISRLEIEELVQWESPEQETEVEEWLFRLIDRTYHATKEEVRGMVEGMKVEKASVLNGELRTSKDSEDNLFSDFSTKLAYNEALDEVLSALEDTTTSPAVS